MSHTYFLSGKLGLECERTNWSYSVKEDNLKLSLCSRRFRIGHAKHYIIELTCISENRYSICSTYIYTNSLHVHINSKKKFKQSSNNLLTHEWFHITSQAPCHENMYIHTVLHKTWKHRMFQAHYNCHSSTLMGSYFHCYSTINNNLKYAEQLQSSSWYSSSSGFQERVVSVSNDILNQQM